jgi:hypothetical protein
LGVLVMALVTLSDEALEETEKPSAYNQAWRPRIQRRRNQTHLGHPCPSLGLRTAVP